jgi:hypothetical protein
MHRRVYLSRSLEGNIEVNSGVKYGLELLPVHGVWSEGSGLGFLYWVQVEDE